MSRRSVFVVGASAVVGVVVGASSLALAQFNPWNNNSVNMRAMTDNWGRQVTSLNLPVMRASLST